MSAGASAPGGSSTGGVGGGRSSRATVNGGGLGDIRVRHCALRGLCFTQEGPVQVMGQHQVLKGGGMQTTVSPHMGHHLMRSCVPSQSPQGRG